LVAPWYKEGNLNQYLLSNLDCNRLDLVSFLYWLFTLENDACAKDKALVYVVSTRCRGS